MKALAALAVAILGTLGIVGLAEVTQNRPDAVEAGTTTVVTFDVGTRDYQRGDEAAARALWAVCSSTVGGEVTTPVATAGGEGGDDGAGGDAYTVTIAPAIGENGRKRLTGCLEDATLDRVMGHVRSISTAA
ncbi:MAG: hypothetical protein ACRDZN_15085 [Acidimicrobiales bacterium]